MVNMWARRVDGREREKEEEGQGNQSRELISANCEVFPFILETLKLAVDVFFFWMAPPTLSQ
jgi:hypothetical protein